MFDVLADLVGDVIIAVIDGAGQWHEVKRLARKSAEREEVVRQRRQLRRKRQHRDGGER